MRNLNSMAIVPRTFTGASHRRLRKRTKASRRAIALLACCLCAVALAACSSAPYRYDSGSTSALESRAETQSAGGFEVRAAVPNEDEAETLLGIPVYDRDVQPVWLEVKNNNSTRARIVVSSLDPKYFPPAEVAWFFKGEFSDEGWTDMEARLIDLALPRFVNPGETVSGLVFTNASSGTKAFNFDVFQGTLPPQYEQFTFFLPVPGFVPDYANVRFRELYAEDELVQVSEAGLPAAIASMDCCTRNEAGTTVSRPVSNYIHSKPLVLLKSLLRAGWQETSITSDDEGTGSVNYLFGRPADGKFRKPRDGTSDRSELAIWKTPIVVDGTPVYAAQLRHSVGRRFPLGDRLFGVRLDPDVAEGRNYVLQTFWYAQTLEKWAVSPTGKVVSEEQPELDLRGNPWFSSDNFQTVIWLSDDPVPMNEVQYLEWRDLDVSGRAGS